MTAHIQLQDISCRTPDGRALFQSLTLAFGPERTGLVGRNGCGKTSLLDIIAGARTPASGTCTVHGRIARVTQHAPDTGHSAAEVLGVQGGLARLARIESGTGSEQDFAEADWMLPERIDTALARMGLGGSDLARPLGSFSGGQRMRLRLAALWIDAPDILLLDEPTNDLDRDGRDLVARLVRDWPGGVVVASHDRDLLAHMDRIVELAPTGITCVAGGWSAFAAHRDAVRAQSLSDLEKAEARLAQMRRAAQSARESKARADARGKRAGAKGGVPKMVLDARRGRSQSTDGREARIAERRIGDAEDVLCAARARVEQLAPLHVDVPRTALPPDRRVLDMEDVCWSTPDGRAILTDNTLHVRGPERIAVEGPNGAGKSTLLALAHGLIAPSSGRIDRHVPSALADQHAVHLSGSGTALEAFRSAHPDRDDHAAHEILARYRFRNSDAQKPVQVLSGGERLRLHLACTLGGATPPGLLILDEPTNHLDLEAMETLEQALLDFHGALLVVSHDRTFLDAIGVTRRIVLG